jgi:hypothetical protein
MQIRQMPGEAAFFLVGAACVRRSDAEGDPPKNDLFATEKRPNS